MHPLLGGEGPPNGGREGICSRRGLVQRGCTPHFLFHLVEKKTGRARSKRKVATLHIRAKLLYGSRRIGASTDLALPSGTLGPSARSVLPSRGGWCPDRRGAKPHLTSFSFRAFRFATRCSGGRRSCCVASLQKPHQPPGQRQRKAAQDVSLTSPGQRFPQGPGVSVPDRREGQPAIPRRRQEVCAGADRPAEHFFSRWRGPTRRTFFLFHRARRIFFLMSQKENGGRICPAINIADSRVQWDAPHPLREQDPPTFRKLRKECILCVQL